MNLSEVVVRDKDSIETLKRKVRIATILGTLQATLTDFRYLRPIWKKNTEEECLLGVSLTGIMDHPLLSGEVAFFEGRALEEVLTEMKQVAIDVNKDSIPTTKYHMFLIKYCHKRFNFLPPMLYNCFLV